MKKLVLIACALAGFVGSALADASIYNAAGGWIGHLDGDSLNSTSKGYVGWVNGNSINSSRYGYVGWISGNSINSSAQGYIGYVDQKGDWHLNNNWFF